MGRFNDYLEDVHANTWGVGVNASRLLMWFWKNPDSEGIWRYFQDLTEINIEYAKFKQRSTAGTISLDGTSIIDMTISF